MEAGSLEAAPDGTPTAELRPPEMEVAVVPIFGPPNVEKLRAKGDVQGLTKALTHKDEAVRRAAAHALGEVGDPRAVDQLVVALRDATPAVGMAAAEALGEIGDARAVYPLVMTAPHTIRLQAVAALASLAQKGSAAAAEAVVAELSRPDQTLQALAIQMLGEMGAPAINPLVAAIGEMKVDPQTAASLLIRIGQSAVDSLVRALRDVKYWATAHVIETLSAIGAPAVQPLISELGAEEQSVRKLAAQALGKIGDARAVDPLIAALNDAETRAAVAEALGELGDARAVQPLIISLADAQGRVRYLATQALANIGDARAIAPLVTVLADADRSVRLVAAEALEKLGWKPPDAAQHALWLVGRADWTAAAALGSAAVDPLIAAMNDPSAETRRDAAEALGKIGDARAIEPLVAALRDDDQFVRLVAAEALEKLGWKPPDDEQYALQLIRELEGAGHETRDGLVRKLTQIGPSAVQPLLAALDSTDREVRRAAAQALGEIGDPRALSPLLSLAADEKRAIREGAAPLANLLERAGPQVPESVLRDIASRSYWEWGVTWEPPDDLDPRCELTTDWGVISADSSRVLQAARQELIRRGLDA